MSTAQTFSLERTGKEEQQIKSYLYVVQSASKYCLPCPLGPCQIVIEPSWKSKKPSTHSPWHQSSLPLRLCLFLNNRHTCTFHLERRGGKKKACLLFGGSPKTPLNKLNYIQPPAQLRSGRLYSVLMPWGKVEGSHAESDRQRPEKEGW